MITRRDFVFSSAYLLANPQFSGFPFSLGVASGDPLPDSVVLWTRLAPDALNGGGMPNENVQVDWEVADDEGMQRVVRRGRENASTRWGHSVHVEVKGLQPARWYFYRFKAGSVVSAVGRTRTAPERSAKLDQFRFAFASCQHYEHGLYTAFRHMAEEDIELVVHLGDYIYERGAQTGLVRQHRGGELTTLDDYRNRYALYKSDELLRRAHERFPWIITWDDHEVSNNYAADKDEKGSPREVFLKRRAAAYQAFYEHMPVRRSAMPRGPDATIYRRFVFGDLADFQVLDERQYRSDQPCGDGNKPHCPEALSESQTMLGPTQERWLMAGLDASRARWNVIANQLMLAKVDRRAGPEEAYAMDQWSGYEAARNRLLSFLGKRQPSNPIFITGDIHSNWVADLKLDFRKAESPTVGTEFVGTSISSGGDGADSQPAVDAYLPENPQVKFYNSQRGYVRCIVKPDKWQSDYRVVSYVTRPGSDIRTRASFVVEKGRPGAQRA